MKRVAIVGNAAGGKSILSLRLGGATGLPVYALDELQWSEGWVVTPAHIFDEKHDALLSKKRWIIDGLSSWPTINKRFAKADTIIFIDYSLWVHYYCAFKRQLLSLFKPRANFPSGCPMLPITKQHFQLIWQIHKKFRPKLIVLIQEYKDMGCTVFHIKSPRELNAFINEHNL